MATNKANVPKTYHVIEPSTGWTKLRLKELYQYRELLWVLTARDIKVRYKQTVLGITWALIQPVSSMIIFSVIFGKLAKIDTGETPYPIFVYAGLLPWTFFSTALSSSAGSILNSGYLLSKVYFPRFILPIAGIGSGILDFFISLTLLFALMVYFNVGLTLNLLAAPLILLGTVLTAVGVGGLLAGVSVRYRDFRYVIPFMIQFWMYISPVVYPPTLIPESYRWLIFLNPMAGFIDGFRAAFLGQDFNLVALGISGSISILFFIAGALVFSRYEKQIADII
jgi:lipopolysaccharide transport system permease protein